MQRDSASDRTSCQDECYCNRLQRFATPGTASDRAAPAGAFPAHGIQQVWSLDFVADQLADGRPFRALTILDVFTRESLAIEVGQHLNGGNVVGVLNLRGTRGAPKLLLCDNGSEFTSQSMDLWADHNRVQIDFSRLGKPTDNAYVESFNGTLRAECLDVHWFASLMEARQNIEACMHACAYQCHLRIINSPDLTIAQKRSWAVEMLRKDGSFICFSFEQRKACESDYLTVSLDRRFSIVMRRY